MFLQFWMILLSKGYWKLLTICHEFFYVWFIVVRLHHVHTTKSCQWFLLYSECYFVVCSECQRSSQLCNILHTYVDSMPVCAHVIYTYTLLICRYSSIVSHILQDICMDDYHWIEAQQHSHNHTGSLAPYISTTSKHAFNIMG